MASHPRADATATLVCCAPPRAQRPAPRLSIPRLMRAPRGLPTIPTCNTRHILAEQLLEEGVEGGAGRLPCLAICSLHVGLVVTVAVAAGREHLAMMLAA